MYRPIYFNITATGCMLVYCRLKHLAYEKNVLVRSGAFSSRQDNSTASIENCLQFSSIRVSG